jgi:LuxR family transcriptional regulator, regulator of acetate metabolism
MRELVDAARLLGLQATIDAEELDTVVAALVERLVEAGDARAEADQRAHEQELENLRRRCAGRTTALNRAYDAAGRLRQLTSPSEILTAAARELTSGSEFDRVVISAVRDGTMIAEVVHFRDDEAGALAALQALRAEPVVLEHGIVETELLRRRRATIVTDAQSDPGVDRNTATVMGWERYAAAPVAVRSSIIAVIQADCMAGRPLDAQHRDVLWEFAGGLADAYEGASLRRTLRQEREHMRALLEWLNARSAELSDAAIELVPNARAPLRPPEQLGQTPATADGDKRAILGGVLTRREVEILRLLADGKTNRVIAAELVISPGTVKFHVNRILRKLRVSNRAEAVSRYFALRETRPRPE